MTQKSTTNKKPSLTDSSLLVVLFWVILGVTGSLPYILGLHLGFTDAIFESVSGFTTTGSTIIGNLDVLPPSILYHRQQIQWLGGMGVVKLHAADSQQGKYGNRQHDNTHPAEPLNLLPVIKNGRG